MWGTKNFHAEFYEEIHKDARHNLTPQQKAMHILCFRDATNILHSVPAETR
jgi:hypothetical protein